MASLKRFLIERDIPGIGNFSVTELCGAGFQSGTQHHRAGDPVAAQLRRRQQDLLHLSCRRRGSDPQARGAERHPDCENHRSAADHRSANGQQLILWAGGCPTSRPLTEASRKPPDCARLLNGSKGLTMKGGQNDALGN